MKKKAVVCVSGGMDSMTALAFASLEHDLYLMHVDYGQLTEGKERDSFLQLAEHFKVPKEQVYVFQTDVLQKVGTSCLTDKSIEVPKTGVNPDTIPVSYVPFRNGNILAMATSLAEAIGATAIYAGFVDEDSSGYPDCREIFVAAFQRALVEGTRPGAHIELIMPVIQMSKMEVIKAAITLQAPIHLSWSCYEAEELACGVCDSCRLRIRGFSDMGLIDPAPYKVNVAWPKGAEVYDVSR